MEEALQFLLGGAVALVGTVVATMLRYSVEERQRKTQRRERRHEGVRRYLVACLKLADLAWEPRKIENIAPAKFGPSQFEEWSRRWSSELAALSSLPASWAVGMYADDDVLLQVLDQVQDFRLGLEVWRLDVASPSDALAPPVTYEQMEEVVVKARKRLDALEDQA